MRGLKLSAMKGKRPFAMRSPRLWLALGLAGLAVALVPAAASCGGHSGSTAHAGGSSGPVVLTVGGSKGSRQFTMADLKAMPAYTGWAGIKTSVGTIHLPQHYTGVKLSDLAAAVGGISSSNKVTMLANDGYGMTFSYKQLMQSGLTTYDPATGAEEKPSETLTVVVAYAVDGKPLPEQDYGQLKLVIATSKPDQVTDGHWAVKWLARVEIGAASSEWSLPLQGAVTTTVDKASYVNCASTGCHGASYTDSAGKHWEGVPLWLIAGRADDKNQHGAGAFNVALAQKGAYSLEIQGAGGKKVTLSSDLVASRRGMIVAYKVDGKELPAAFYPLRLVGPGLSATQSVGRMLKIRLRFK